MRLYIKQKVFSITDKYNIYDEIGNTIFTVKNQMFSLGARFHLCDMNGNELYFIQQKLIALMAEYNIFKEGAHYARIKRQFSFMRPKINVESDYGTYQILGDAWAHDFNVNFNGQYLGSVHKKYLSWGDSYELDIVNKDDPAFFCCLVIAIDNCLHNESNS